MVFVFGAIPGERVAAVVRTVRRRHVFADTEEILRPSDDRVEPPCPLFGRCGGCHWQHVAAPRQLALKVAVVLDALRRAGCPAEPETVDQVAAVEPLGYRWRGEFHRIATPGAVRLGFTERHGYRRLPIEACPLHHPAINRALPQLAAALDPGRQPAGDATLHLTVGEAGAELLVEPRPDRAGAATLIARAGPELDPRLSDATTGLRYRQMAFRVTPASFIQVNQGMVEALYETVAAWLGPAGAGHVVDAYAGIGVLSCRLAERARRVTAIELNPQAAALCRLHAELNGVQDRLAVRRGPVEVELAAAGPADAVVVDPPRAGLTAPVLGQLGLGGPPVLVYVSCEPAALARDLHILCTLGPYRLDRLRIVDCFPQTYHVETVARLSRR